MSEAIGYEALADRLNELADSYEYLWKHLRVDERVVSPSPVLKEAAAALRQAAQEARDLDQEMRRVEMVRNYALDHIENAEREVGTGGSQVWNLVGRGAVGEQLLEIVEARVEEETDE